MYVSPCHLSLHPKPFEGSFQKKKRRQLSKKNSRAKPSEKKSAPQGLGKHPAPSAPSPTGRCASAGPSSARPATRKFEFENPVGVRYFRDIKNTLSLSLSCHTVHCRSLLSSSADWTVLLIVKVRPIPNHMGPFFDCMLLLTDDADC